MLFSSFNIRKIGAGLFLFSLILVSSFFAQNQFNVDYDTVRAQKFDTGKMWTFDYPPLEYFKGTYDFQPTEEWLQHVRLSALRYGGGCTASFVSADGLIMTNHHCAQGALRRIQQEGEDLRQTGFYAPTFEEERKIPGLTVNQLVFLTDVTNEVHQALNKGNTEEEKIKNKDEKIKELQTYYSNETGLDCRIVSMYNGGKYSIYGYKIYDDLRMVFIPETEIAYFGGDYDNFTYPRYNLDCAFVRAYDENGQPVNSENYLRWSSSGAPENDVIFTVGNPARTNRLYTMTQLIYFRDVAYRNRAFQLDNLYNKLEDLKSLYPEREDEFENMRVRIGNSQKVMTNIEKGLQDPYLIARKKAFEKELMKGVNSDPELKKKYGHVWAAIKSTRDELTEYDKQIAAYSLSRFYSSDYFFIANDLIQLAEQLKLPDEERDQKYKNSELDSLIGNFYPEDFDKVMANAKLEIQAEYITINLGKDNKLVKKLFDGRGGKEAVNYLLGKSFLANRDDIKKLASQTPDDILNSEDPFIYFVMQTRDELKRLQNLSKEINDTEDVYLDLLGRAMFEVYGTSIPPDANGTLRISDGLLKGFEYNGTVAPVKTTFYGLYDRYYSNDGKYPWNLPERWLHPGKDFDQSTPVNFISTNDIVGGNSGSPVINRSAEVVGLAFDGNIHSIIGNFIYMSENNRMVAVSSMGMIEAFRHIYHAERLADELTTGRLTE